MSSPKPYQERQAPLLVWATGPSPTAGALVRPFTPHLGTALRTGPDRTAIELSAVPEVLQSAHPLCLIGRLIHRQTGSALGSSGIPRESIRLLRAALLQPLYSFDAGQLLEQLHYNLLYRSFVGLNPYEPVWDAIAYTDALEELRTAPASGRLFRETTSQVRAIAQFWAGYFRIDEALFDSWGKTPDATGTTLADSGDETLLAAAGVPPPCERRCTRFEKALAVILERMGDATLTVDALASAACVSRRSLYLLFKERGLTPSRAIRDIRLERCRQALSDPDPQQQRRKITDIALDFGFADITSFTRQFRNRYGKPPRDFRVSARTAHAHAN